jgi:hypothetical protein
MRTSAFSASSAVIKALGVQSAAVELGNEWKLILVGMIR